MSDDFMEKKDKSLEWRQWFEEEWNRICQAAARYSNLHQIIIIPDKNSDLYTKRFGGDFDEGNETR